MGKPTKRRSPTKVKPKVQPPKSSPKKTEVYRPKRFALDQDQIASQNGSMPFHAMIGEGRLEPYVWINLKGDKENILSIQNGTKRPLREGLKKVVLKNEIGKYPTVEFEMYVPDYRDKKGPKIQDKITLFKMGANFSVKWGYRNAHTKWSNLVVYEHKIAFEEGTAVLKVKGKAGNRLSATNTNEVFTAEYGKSGIEQLASVVGMKVDHKELLEEELEDLRVSEEGLEEAMVLTAGKNFGASVWAEANRHGIDFFVNPEREEIRLASPYKLDLIKRGAEAYRMTYGFPASPIASIEYTKKYPKKKRSRGSYRKSMSQKAKGGTGSKSDDNTMILRMVHGVFVKGGDSLSIGNPSTSASFSSIEEAQKTFPNHVIQKRNVGTVGIFSPPNGETFHIFKEIEVGKGTLHEESKILSKSEFKALSQKSNVALSVMRVETIDKIHTKIWTITDPTRFGDKTPPPPSPENTTRETTPDLKWVETRQVSFPAYAMKNEKLLVVNEDSDFFIGNDSRQKQLRRFKKMKADALKDTNRFKLEKTKIGTHSITIHLLELKTPDGAKLNQKAVEEEIAEPPSQDGNTRAESKPSGKGSYLKKGSSGKIVTSISVKTKVGDWTLRVGRLLEIVDLYSLVDGYYSISSEEHTIDVSGFHTKVVAKKATSKTVDRYGGRAGGSPSSKTRKKGDAKSKVEKKKTAFVEKVEQELFVQGTQSFRLFDPY